jgi:murein DD-endopeptidase MepM/ murein hydrolase activator NlpD
VARLRHLVERLFPERHVYLRSGGETRGYILTTGKQLLMASGAGLLGVWLILATASTVYTTFAATALDKEVARTTAKYERLMADQSARLNGAVTKLSESANSVDDLARTVERRHAALTRVMLQFKGVPGASDALAPAPPLNSETRAPVERVMAVRLDQERLIAKAETFARTRAERLRLALRLAGLRPEIYSGRTASSLGGPLIDSQDPKALAAVLDVDEPFAYRIQNAVNDLADMRSLDSARQRLPFGRPAFGVNQTSGFGFRFDPFNHRPALHSGLDFSGPFLTPIHATGPGVVSFTGVRTGYGNTIEIDHGGGFKTRYAHLQTISVKAGDRVALGQRIGGMGSTGRSTGVHLHYEVWVNGRPQNPVRFVKAGDYVQQK